jgi:hypothetical protein
MEMGYRTPNIDRIADEGMRFTDSYGEQSCTADWLMENAILALTASALVTQFLETFKEFPPRQEAATFTIDKAIAKLEAALTEGR